MKLKYIEGRLGYNRQTGRYGLLVMDLWKKTGFSCGESLEIWENGKWLQTRMEMNYRQEWYLVGTSYVGTDLEYIRTRIKAR